MEAILGAGVVRRVRGVGVAAATPLHSASPTAQIKWRLPKSVRRNESQHKEGEW